MSLMMEGKVTGITGKSRLFQPIEQIGPAFHANVVLEGDQWLMLIIDGWREDECARFVQLVAAAVTLEGEAHA